MSDQRQGNPEQRQGNPGQANPGNFEQKQGNSGQGNPEQQQGHAESRQGQFRCEACHQAFNSNEELRRHNETAHKGQNAPAGQQKQSHAGSGR
jgi:hypothetical protein